MPLAFQVEAADAATIVQQYQLQTLWSFEKALHVAVHTHMVLDTPTLVIVLHAHRSQ